MSELQLFCVFLSAKSGYVGVPKQLVITGDAASISSSVAAAGLKLPLGLYQLYTSHCLYERCQ
jgi:hypothetical protein